MSKSFFSKRVRILAALTVLPALLLASMPVNAAPSTGTVNVSATNTTAMIMTIGNGSANFGTGLDPTGAGAAGLVSATQPGLSASQGVYYVWKPVGALVTVRSNLVWNGTVAASENSATGAPSLTIGSSALRYATSAPSTYDQAAAATAFTTGKSVWPSSGAVAAGTSSYAYDYLLRIDWNDKPGAFSSTVTYVATP